MLLDYGREALEGFVVAAIGEDGVARQWPRVDRLITLWIQGNELAGWLEENSSLIGGREYKEMVTAYNTLMQNIRNLENDLSVFERRVAVEDSSGLMDALSFNSAKAEQVEE